MYNYSSLSIRAVCARTRAGEIIMIHRGAHKESVRVHETNGDRKKEKN